MAPEEISDTSLAPNEPVDCDPALRAGLQAWSDGGFEGSFVSVEGGELVCSFSVGLADRTAARANTSETVFHLGSVTKTFTAAAVLDLIDSGLLGFETTAGSVLPDLTGPAAESTVAQLLAHTSGLQGLHGRDREPLSAAEAINTIGGLPIAFEPGSDNLYSNSGYTLLALMIEELTGSYREYLVEHILRPSADAGSSGFWDGEPAAEGPRAIGYLDDGSAGQLGSFEGPHWASDGNGGLAMTTEGLALWVAALADGGVISPAAVDKMMTPLWDHGDGSGESPGWVLLDASVLGELSLSVAGGGDSIGHNMVVAWFPESDKIYAIASNTTGVLAENLLRRILPALLSGDPIPVPVASREADQGSVTGLPGRYEFGDDWFEVTSDNGRLVIAAAGSAAIAALFPPVAGFDADAYDAHEEAVRVFLGGETELGRTELENLQGALGEIESVEIVGTIFDEIELRTYVTFDTAEGQVPAWFALDDSGSLAGALLEVDPPSLQLVADGDSWIPLDVGEPVPPVVVSFDEDDSMVVTGPEASVIAPAG